MTESTAARPAVSVPEPIQSLVLNHWQGRAVAVAAELELADLLENGPLSLETLAEKTQTHAPSLFRLLRALESVGVFAQTSPKVFSNTPASDCLRKSAPNSQRAWVLLALSTDEMVFRGWTGLVKGLRSGGVAFDEVEGCKAWDFMQREPERGTLFNLAMRAAGAGMTEAVTSAFDWGRFPAIADIAGGIGTQLVSILEAYPRCRGILFDQPSVVSEALPHNRMTRVPGDFFQGVPAGADAYVMRWIIHDWADPESIRILQNVRRTIQPTGRLVLIEAVLLEGPGFDFAKWMDLNMMVMAGGHERTPAEYAALFAKSGFELEEVVPTSSALSLVVGKPV
jgi:O-methyltransferase domain/Dimerisation domain